MKRASLTRPRFSPFSLAVFTLAPDLSFEYGPSLAFAKNTTVLQSTLTSLSFIDWNSDTDRSWLVSLCFNAQSSLIYNSLLYCQDHTGRYKVLHFVNVFLYFSHHLCSAKAIPIKRFVSHRPTDPFFGKSKKKKKIRITSKEASTLVYKHTILS